jgi:predicted DNA-binding transcriptional regulator AlpA
MKEGSFPRRVKLSSRTIAFVEHEVDEWMIKTINEANS